MRDTLVIRILAPTAGALVALTLISLVVHAILLRRAADDGLREIALHRLELAVAEIAARSAGGEKQPLSIADGLVTWDRQAKALNGTAIAEPERAHFVGLGSKVRSVLVAIQAPQLGHPAVRTVVVSAQFPDGTWVNVREQAISLLSADDLAFRITIGGAGILLLVALAAAARAIASPLVRLQSALRGLPAEGAVVLPVIKGPREVKELRDALCASMRRAQELLEQRSLALGALSHDIITPISRLKFRTYDIADEDLRDRMLRDLGEMEEMVQDVLAYLRGVDGGGEAPVRLSVASLTQVVIDEFAEAGIVIEERVLTDATVIAPPVAVKRAIRNLVGNAVKYGTDPWVEVQANQTQVEIRVGDSGIGMTPADIARAFEPFFRGNRARSRGEGSGLGLSTARAIARAHGGDVTLQSVAEQGTTATLRLPLA